MDSAAVHHLRQRLRATRERVDAARAAHHRSMSPRTAAALKAAEIDARLAAGRPADALEA